MNEPELAEAIERLRGEWAERFGGSLAANSKPWHEVAADDALDADVIIFPTRYLGELCTRDWLRPVRSHVLEDEAFDANDIFPLVRRRLMTWGGRVMALPLGVDVPTTSEPIGRRPAVSLLVEAAPNAVSADRTGVLINPETMKPRITEPPFVEALSQLSDSDGVADASRSASVRRVPVLGVGDRMVAVTSSSRNAATAFKLIGWLAGPDISPQVARAAGGTMPVRRSLASSPVWYDPSLSASERNELGKALDESLNGQQCLLIPRIPGIDQYLAALDDVVRSAVAGKVEPQAALEQAAARWEAITDTHGRDAQRQAYLKHLGIDEP